ncbi:substrate-binding periplasmic protein [Alkalilimnicola ehrlichii MLHE-1]|uniref:Amino acid ABC transporter substrate-binding protein, PAAT family n=1 Tax=Alkalilimnicola ehrlichii (strain ATCC BAA-1101 / DSM 17681 / MLHE-1) TaxID=187272 RepID=Q0A516_ALKEH|nr:transporter substrate-binding domain-containing protein [Alkalilimnicola ehrlichii]ABI58071.1 amino acid ABC transporter substrate-binding protein, PAAT family [Alkalilimnicola ehrlichii MLHE-1]
MNTTDLIKAGRLAATAALCGATLFAGSANAERLHEIRDRGTLTVALYNDFGPYSCVGTGGELIGVDVALARALGEKLDLKVELAGFGAQDSMDQDLALLQDEQAEDEWDEALLERAPDLMMHVPVDPVFQERNADYDIMGAYFHEAMAVLYDREEIGDLGYSVNTPDPFDGLRVGVEMYTYSYTMLTNGFDGRLRSGVVNHKNVPEAVEALLAGETSAVFAPRGELQSALAAFPEPRTSLALSELRDLFRTDRVRSDWDVGMAVKAGNPELSRAVEEAMAQLVADGTVERIFNEYGIAWVGPGEEYRLARNGNGPAGVTRTGLERAQLCRATMPAGLY